MPTYEYVCEACGRASELRCSFADRPDILECACGHDAVPRISGGQLVLMRDRPYEFDRSKNVMSFGRKFGRSDQKQHERYQRKIQEMREIKRSVQGSRRRADIEWLGTMPGEMVDSIGQHEGDKEAVYRDPVTFLKKNDLYEGD